MGRQIILYTGLLLWGGHKSSMDFVTERPNEAHPQVQCEFPVATSQRTMRAYQRRGDRCEGYFGEPTGSSFRVLALGPQHEPITRDSKAAEVRWWARGRERIVLRAKLSRGTANYQMDTHQLVESGRYSWPLELVREFRLDPNSFELACWIRTAIGPVYVPCQFAPAGAAAPGPLVLTLLAQQPLNGLRVNAYALERGTEGRRVISDQVVGGGPYGPGRRIRVPLDGLGRPGQYRVVVECMPRRVGCGEQAYDVLLAD